MTALLNYRECVVMRLMAFPKPPIWVATVLREGPIGTDTATAKEDKSPN